MRDSRRGHFSRPVGRSRVVKSCQLSVSASGKSSDTLKVRSRTKGEGWEKGKGGGGGWGMLTLGREMHRSSGRQSLETLPLFPEGSASKTD